MQRLRGSFSAAPIEKVHLVPHFNPKVIRQKARLRRLQRKGLTPPGDKASLRAAAAEAAASHPIRKV